MRKALIITSIIVLIILGIDIGIYYWVLSTGTSPIEDNFNRSTEEDCLSNIYNCGDFSTQEEAQAVFDRCGGVDSDIHALDNDSDGVVCESLA